jgi:restriction endonuclease S subunit
MSSTSNNTRTQTLNKFQIAIPPVEVQDEIVNFIEINNRIILNLENEINDIKHKSSLWFLNTI